MMLFVCCSCVVRVGPRLFLGPTYLAWSAEAPAVARSSPTTTEEANLLFTMMLFVCCSCVVRVLFVLLCGSLSVSVVLCYTVVLLSFADRRVCVDVSFVSNEDRS